MPDYDTPVLYACAEVRNAVCGVEDALVIVGEAESGNDRLLFCRRCAGQICTVVRDALRQGPVGIVLNLGVHADGECDAQIQLCPHTATALIDDLAGQLAGRR